MVLIFKGISRRIFSGKRKIQGRSHGLISVKHRGGSLKRNYRFIEYFSQKWLKKWLFVLRIEYDPNRSAFIALCSLIKEGLYLYKIATDKVEVGSLIFTNNNLHNFNLGYTTILKNIPDGFLVNNIELFTNSGSKLTRAAGTSSIVIRQYNKKYSLIKLNSKENRILDKNCFASLGIVSNPQHKLKKVKKAGNSRYKGFRPRVRGLVMNPVDHPHGGRTKGGMHWKSYSGKLTANVSTRRIKKYTNKFIIVGHRKERLRLKK